MAKIKISALPETASLQATDLVTAVANSISSKVTIKNLANSLTQVSSSISSSYADNGGVTSIIAGASISVSPADGKGAVTVSYGGGGGAFPFTGSARITGSINLVGDIVMTGSLLVTQSHISTLDYIDFTTNPPTIPHNEGRIHWDLDRKTLEIDTEINNYMISAGHVNVLRGKNDNSYTLTAGTVVYINGNSGQFATFGTASWEDDPSSAYTIGIIPQNISPSNSGYAVIQGEITGINTNGFTPGTLLYLSSSGTYTDQKPVAPRHTVRLGQVVVASVSGKLQIKVDNGYETDELHDVKLTNTSSGDLFVKSGSIWINSKQLTGSYGLTGSLTAINGGFTGSLFGTSSWATNALTASFVRDLNQNVTITGSLTISSSAAIELSVIGNCVITGSLVVSGSNGAGVFSQGATLIDYVSGISNSGSYMVWRAPFSCSVVAVYGYREGGGPANINAARSGSSGYGLIMSSDMSLTVGNFWSASSAIQNTTFNTGDSLKLIMSGSASNNQLAVQVDFIRKF